MGLIKEGDKFAILSDILGMEDHLGDMDFKVAGTVKGVTALQMDIKIKGLSYDIITKALAQAHKGRLHILDKMAEALSESRKELSPDAPRIYALKINPEKIGTVIGPGGKTIRSITSETGVEMDIEEDGTVRIFTMDAAMADKALKMVSDLTAEVEVGKIYEGTVVRVVNFGCFVQILPGKDGLVHISELEQGRVNQVTDVCDVGDKITVKVMAIDEMGRVNLSRRACLPGYVDTGEDKPRRERSNDRPPRRDNNRNHSNSRRN
jgi:polyribonucleotide nucleotidyltransferase